MKRSFFLDLAKILLAFMVVGIHGIKVNEIPSIFYDITVNGIFRLAVPMFILVTGYYFCDKIKNTRPWFERVVILYVFWQIFYSYYWLQKDYSVQGFLAQIVLGYYHLWYLPAMIFAAALLTLLKSSKSSYMFCLIATLFSTGVGIQYGILNYLPGSIGYLNFIEKHSLLLSRNFLFFVFPFFVLGYLIKKENIVEKLSNKSLIPYIVIFAIALIFESLLVSSLQLGTNRDLLIFLFPLAPLVFMQLLKLNISANFSSLAVISSVVYFLHIFILKIVDSITATNSVIVVVITCFIGVVLGYLAHILKPHARLLNYIF